jgi:CDP-diacylglycerol---glycerol-3-phosphate 3-phosphatidyltransferase
MKPGHAMKQLNAGAAAVDVQGAYVNLPNLITFGRILLIPVFIVVFYEPTPERSVAAAVVFVIAAVTDVLDGYLARRRGQVTNLGRLLDPVADKLLVLSGLVLLVEYERVDALIAILIMAREVAVTGVRAAAASEGVVMAAETTGKYKMTAQVVAIVMLILDDTLAPYVGNLHEPGLLLLYVALALGLYSGARYLVTFWREVAGRIL